MNEYDYKADDNIMATEMEVDSYTRTAVFDLPIESIAQVTSYLRSSSSTAPGLQKVILSTSQHALEKVYRCAIIERAPDIPAAMEVDTESERTLFDLPIESLTQVASYLTTTSRALFTVALALDHVLDSSRTTPRPSTCQQFEQAALSAHCVTALLAGNQWDTLDFGAIEQDLASRLRDCDIQAVFLVIDAVNKVRTLRMSNCTNITGSCLEALRGSLVLEKIDLSLVGDTQSPKISPAPPISFDHVLPILDGIIQRGNSRLSHIQFPYISRAIVLGRTPGSSQFRQFVTRYNDMWKNRGVVGCSKCSANINACGSNEWMHSNRWMHIFGIQFNTCYSCTRHYCDECASKVLVDEMGRVDTQMLAFCANCQKYFCADCKRMERCQVGIGCDKYVCSDCDFLRKCSGCSWKMCGDCFCERRVDSRCNEAYCDFCE